MWKRGGKVELPGAIKKVPKKIFIVKKISKPIKKFSEFFIISKTNPLTNLHYDI